MQSCRRPNCPSEIRARWYCEGWVNVYGAPVCCSTSLESSRVFNCLQWVGAKVESSALETSSVWMPSSPRWGCTSPSMTHTPSARTIKKGAGFAGPRLPRAPSPGGFGGTAPACLERSCERGPWRQLLTRPRPVSCLKTTILMGFWASTATTSALRPTSSGRPPAVNG